MGVFLSLFSFALTLVFRSLDALPECIHSLETYDVTTIRASLPMYLLR